MQAKKVYLSLGSNLGNREQNLEQAIAALEREHIRVEARSSIYETEPRDVRDQPWFLNMVVECETEYFPLQLLAVLQRIEREMGRVRRGAAPRGPRLIDIDILLFGTVKIKTAKLEVPHPRMLERRFVLEPLLEIAPGFRDAAAALERVRGQIVRKV
jgi:2-amino-4-hydroxy-6-hydroxymethyldihydropteridine diphosphokinase